MPQNNYQMLRNQRLRDQNTSSVLMSGARLGQGARPPAVTGQRQGPGSIPGQRPTGVNAGMGGNASGGAQIRPAQYQRPMSGTGTGWQQGGVARSAQQAIMQGGQNFQPGTTWWTNRPQGNTVIPSLQPLTPAAGDNEGVARQDPRSDSYRNGGAVANAAPASNGGPGRTGTQSSALQNSQQGQGNAGQGGGGSIYDYTAEQYIQQAQSNPANTPISGGGTLQGYADAFGFDAGVLGQLIAEGWSFSNSPGGQPYVSYTDANGQRVSRPWSPGDVMYTSAVARLKQPGQTGTVQDLYKQYGISDQPPQMDRGELDNMNAMTARRYAQQQGRILQSNANVGARAGASADQMAGSMGDTASQFGMASAEEQARNEMQYQVQNFQAELDFYNKQFQAGMSLFADAQSDEDRDKGYAHAMRMLTLAEQSQKRMLDYQNELANRITWKDVLGGILGGGMQLGSAALGGYLAGGMGGGIPQGAARGMASRGSLLLNPYGAAYGY